MRNKQALFTYSHQEQHLISFKNLNFLKFLSIEQQTSILRIYTSGIAFTFILQVTYANLRKYGPIIKLCWINGTRLFVSFTIESIRSI